MALCNGPAQPNQSLAHGLACLLELASSDGPLGSRQVARALDMEPTRANRLLGTLAQLGLASRTADRRYTVGPGISILAAMALRRSRLLTCALPHIRRFQEATGLGVALGMLWRRDVCYLYHGSPGSATLAAITGQDLFPAEVSSIGQVLLSELPEEAVRRLYAGGPGPRPAGLDVEALLGLLGQVRARGYGVLAGQSVAVPVGHPAVAGLAAMGVEQPDGIPAAVARLRGTAQAIRNDVESNA